MAGRLASLTRPVRLALYTRADGCDTCADTQAILDEVAGLSPHLSVERHDHPAGEVAPGVEHVPAIVVLRDVDGVRSTVSHDNKWTKGRLARLLCEHGARSGRDVAELGRTLADDVEVDGRRVDLVLRGLASARHA